MPSELVQEALPIMLRDSDSGVRRIALRLIISNPHMAQQFKDPIRNMSRIEVDKNNKKLLEKAEAIINQ